MISRGCYLGVIPARAGSKRIPGKNLVRLNGVPLIDYSVRAAQGSERLTAVIVSTDSPEIASHARSLGVAVPDLRPPQLAEDRSPVVAALAHGLGLFERAGTRADAVVLLQPTSPLRQAADIDRAIELFERTGADTVTAVRSIRDHPYWAWRASDDLIVPFHSETGMATDRQELPPVYAENGAVYVIRRELVVAGRIYGARVAPYVMQEEASVDVDTPLDLAWAEFLLSRQAGPTGSGLG